MTTLRPPLDADLTSTGSAAHPSARPRLAWAPVGSAMVVLTVSLTATSGAYGYFRDELYFRMLPARWGYVDQPPFTPLLVRLSSVIADDVWAVRIPATIAALGAVLLVALIVRELGGGPFAQGLAAWGYGFGSVPVAFGHTSITAGWDVVAWLATLLFVTRAVLREEPQWWLAAGAVLGLATWNKLLIPLLVASLVVGFTVAGPRRLPWRYVLGARGLALVISAPQVLYQVTHAFPQLVMADALAESAGAANRAQLAPFLLVILAPVLVPVWVAGLVALLRQPTWRRIRFMGVAALTGALFTLLVGGAPYYLLGFVAVTYAAGCVKAAAWVTRSVTRRRMVAGAVAANAAVAAVVGLPVIPVSWVGSTPLATVNEGVRGSVGWPEYVGQVASAYATLTPTERAEAVVVATTFGEAGAIARYGPALGLPAVVSGHNELADTTSPPHRKVTAVVVGRGAPEVANRNAACTEVTRLDNHLHVDTDEQGQPIAVCWQPREPWLAVWPQFRHDE